jgi:hypothetical protein
MVWWPSGLWRLSTKQKGVKAPWVRIPPTPPDLICGINSKVEYQVVALIMLVRFQHVTPNYIVRWLSWFKVLDWKSSVSRNGGRGFEPHSHCQINSMMAERLKALISKISNLKRFMGSNPIHASKKKEPSQVLYLLLRY